MRSLLDVLRLLHICRQHYSVAACERDVQRAKRDLELAIDARDRAIANQRIAETPPRKPPSFLLVDARQPAVAVRSIAKRRKTA